MAQHEGSNSLELLQFLLGRFGVDSNNVQANLLRILEACQEFDIPCATGANTPDQVAMRMDQGFRIIITAPDKSTPGLNEGRRLANR